MINWKYKLFNKLKIMARNWKILDISLDRESNELKHNGEKTSITKTVKDFLAVSLGSEENTFTLTQQQWETVKNAIDSKNDPKAKKLLEECFKAQANVITELSGLKNDYNSEKTTTVEKTKNQDEQSRVNTLKNKLNTDILEKGLNVDILHDTFKEILDDKKVSVSEIELLSIILWNFNKMWIAIWGFKNGKIELTTWDNTDSNLNDNKQQFQKAINSYIKNSSLEIGHFISASALRSSQIDKYLDAKNNKLDPNEDNTKNYAKYLVKSYKITVDINWEETDIFEEIKKAAWTEDWANMVKLFKKAINNSIKIVPGKNTLADKEFLMMYIDALYENNKSVSNKNSGNEAISHYKDLKDKAFIKELWEIPKETLAKIWMKDSDELAQAWREFREDPKAFMAKQIKKNAPMVVLFSIIWLVMWNKKGFKQWIGLWLAWGFAWAIWPSIFDQADFGEIMKWDISSVKIGTLLEDKVDVRKSKNEKIINQMYLNTNLDKTKTNKVLSTMFSRDSKSFAKNVKVWELYNSYSSKTKNIEEIFNADENIVFYDASKNIEISWIEFYRKNQMYIDTFFIEIAKHKNIQELAAENVWALFDAVCIEEDDEEKKEEEKKEETQSKNWLIEKEKKKTVKEILKSININWKSAIIALFKTTYWDLKVQNIETLSKTPRWLELMFKDQKQEKVYNHFSDSITQISTLIIENETNKDKTLKDVLA